MFAVQEIGSPSQNRSSRCYEIHSELQRDGHALLITFAGFLGAIGGVPRLEFEHITNDLPVKRIFVCDLRAAFYQQGWNDLEGELGALRLRAAVSKVVCVGNCMGSYAALRMGHVLAASDVLAFAPRTMISWPWTVLTTFGHGLFTSRVRRELTVARSARRFSARTDLDLRILLQPPRFGRAVLFCDRHDHLDRTHAMRMRGIPNVELRWLETGGHNAVKVLRDTGELKDILKLACL